MKDLKQLFVPVVAICAIAFLEWQWMKLGHNGVYFTMSIACIAGISGYKIAGVLGVSPSKGGPAVPE